MMEFHPLDKVIALIISVSAVPAAGIGKDSSPDAIPVDCKVEGASIHYTPLAIPKSKRTARGELEMLERAAATLQVEKPISLRRTELLAGSYAVRIEAEDGKSYFLVIERKSGRESPAKERAAPRASRKKPAVKPAHPGGALEKEEGGKKEDGKKEDGELETAPAKTDEAGATGIGVSPRNDEVTNEASPDVSPAEGVKAKAPSSIRAPLALSAGEKNSDQVTFELRAGGKGSKLRVTVRAGGTEARTSLKFGATEARVTRPAHR